MRHAHLSATARRPYSLHRYERRQENMSFAQLSHSEELDKGIPSVTASPVASNTKSLPLPTRIAFVGNYLPRQCGIATFTTDLCTALGKEYGSERLFAIPVNDPD